jgi:glutamate 5-kinase
MAAMTSTINLKRFRRIAVKIGSSLLIDANGGLRTNWLNTLADDLAELSANGTSLMVVSSGAIALGRGVLGLGRRSLTLEQSQAAAAVGQIALAHAYKEVLGTRGLAAAQVLLTLGDTEERRRYLNARNTIGALLKLKAVPVINENDTVATNEIRYGDNDRLAARVAAMMSADCLVLLSDVDGLYTRVPGQPGAEFVERVERITPEIEAMAGSAGSDLSRGGMVTKIEAAKIATAAGAHLIIASGKVDHPLHRLNAEKHGTLFVPNATPATARKTWIAGALEPKGAVIIDAGAGAALEAGKSLLPAGIVGFEGSFLRGDAIVVRTEDGRELGRGLSAYDLEDARAIAGCKSGEIAAILGYAGRSELIHRDDLVLKRD